MSLRTKPVSIFMTVFAVVATYLVAAVAASGPAAALSGTVTVSVVGKGTVTGDGGISCTESGGPTCSKSYPYEVVCPDPKHEQAPPIGCTETPALVSLTAAADRDGFAFDHFDGCNSTSGRTCTVYATVSKDVTAVFVDVAGPVVTLTKPTNGSVVGATMQVAATATDTVGVSKVEFRAGGGVLLAMDSTPPYSATVDTSVVAGSSAMITARAYDTSGNATDSAASTVTIDRQGPDLVVTGPNGETFGPGSTQAWTFAVTDLTSVVAICTVTHAGVTVSSGACSAGNAGHSVSGLAEGVYQLHVLATDQANNTTSATRTFTIDATAPETSVTSGPMTGALLASRAVSFGVASNDPGATVGCRLYRSGTTAPAFAPCTSATSFSASGLDDGSYVFEARAVDGAGNGDATPARRTFTVDTTAPTVSIGKTPKRTVKTARKKVTVRLSFSSEPGAVFRCTLDGKTTTCPASASFTVKVGKHTLSVVAVDAAGNVSQPAAVSFKVKRVPKHR